METMALPTIFDKKTTAQLLSISVASLDRLMRDNKIAYHKLGRQVRFSETQVRKFLKETERQAMCSDMS